MRSYQARAVHVLADTDHGEGWITFEWPDDLSGWDCLRITLDGHCSRRMPIYSGSGVERIELSRDRIRLWFTPELAGLLRLEPDTEIGFATSDAVFAELRAAVEHLGGDVAMTEAEWLACTDPTPMLEFLRGKASDRKLRLFSVACDVGAGLERHFIAAFERHADGIATSEDEWLLGNDWTPAWQSACLSLDHNVRKPEADWLRDIFGYPFRPVTADPRWLTSTAVALARTIYDDRAFDRLPILADALEEAGCDNTDVLSHLRGDGPHVRGCWAVDLVLGKQ